MHESLPELDTRYFHLMLEKICQIQFWYRDHSLMWKMVTSGKYFTSLDKYNTESLLPRSLLYWIPPFHFLQLKGSQKYTTVVTLQFLLLDSDADVWRKLLRWLMCSLILVTALKTVAGLCVSWYYPEVELVVIMYFREAKAATRSSVKCNLLFPLRSLLTGRSAASALHRSTTGFSCKSMYHTCNSQIAHTHTHQRSTDSLNESHHSQIYCSAWQQPKT